ncbi:DNA ligase [Paenibacillus sp. NPDC093718]|uniref:ATP-dependent DNA ligase n=1 Tax=Paenibacillus sp. NPDC093718 TaxID=3390601 RepID=UPI003D00A23D
MIDPMLLADLKEPFESDDHIAELKLDGIRALLEVDHDRVRLYTRHQNDITFNFEEITKAATSAVSSGTTLDGELVVCDIETGKPDFEAMMSRFQSRPKLGRTPGLAFVAFDIIRHQGNDLRSLDLMSRKAILEEALIENEVIKRIRFMEHSFIPLFNLCKGQGLEGIVIKKRNSRYYYGQRPKDLWQRVVVYQREVCVVMGYSKRELAWLLGIERDGKLIPAGMVKYGLTPAKRKKVFPILANSKLRETSHFVYVDPLIRVGVRFRHWTKDGKMRLAVLEEVL